MRRTVACWLVFAVVVLVSGTVVLAEGAPDASKFLTAIWPDDLRAQVGFLASDECGGRLTGSPGAEQSARFIATVFEQAGLQKAPGHASYFQEFEFASGVEQLAEQNSLSFAAGESSQPAELGEDFVPLTFSDSGTAEGALAFVGYGLVVPASGEKGYDSYAGVDVTDKIVLALRDVPEKVSAERRQELALYAGDRYKAKLAADRGAKAFLLVTGPNSPGGGALIEFRSKDRNAAVGIPAMSISGALAERMLTSAAVDTKGLQTALDQGQLNPHAQPELDVTVQLTAGLKRVTGTCRNVVGVLPPTGGGDEYVLVGAHYDHIGTGEGLGSLAKGDERGKVHNGADDNASGTATVLELAAQVAEQCRQAGTGTPRRGLIFACWSGEELGLVGSSHYLNHPLVPLDKTVAVFNFDMVGRLRNNQLIVQAVGSSPAWRKLVEKRNVRAGFSLTLQDDPYLPTDATGFYTKGVPTLSFFTDLHAEYNRPGDDAHTLNYEGMERVARFAQQLIADVARPDTKIAYAEVKRSAPPEGRMGRRVYTGVVPDFAAADVKGLRVANVREGGPADQAGLEPGDVIIEFAGKRIQNLQDYSDALMGAKVDEPVLIGVMRNNTRVVSLWIVPTAPPK